MKAVTRALAKLGVPTDQTAKLSGDKAKSAPKGGFRGKQCSYCKKRGHEKVTCYLWERHQGTKDPKDPDGVSKQRAMTTESATNTDSEGSIKVELSDADPVMTIRAVPETSRQENHARIGLIGQDLSSALLPYEVICPEPIFDPRDMPRGNPIHGNSSDASAGIREQVTARVALMMRIFGGT